MLKLDKEDEHLLEEYSWFQASTGYWCTRAKQSSAIGSPKQMMYLHRLIMMPPKELEIDHINHDREDNRRCNLRFATRSQNMLNISIQKNNTSGVTGVSYDKNRNKWIAQCGKHRKAGFVTKEDAILWKERLLEEFNVLTLRCN